MHQPPRNHSPSTKDALAKAIAAAAQNGTLFHPKHDPVSGSIAYPSFRTVVSTAVSSSLEAQIAARAFDVVEYQSVNHPGPQYVVELTGGATPVAHGFPSGSTTPATQCDRLVFVSGTTQGLHVYGESQARLDAMVASGSAVRVGALAPV